MSNEVVIQNARASFVYLFGDGRENDQGRKSWSMTAIVPKTDTAQIEKIKKAIQFVKDNNVAKLGKTGVKSPLLDGDAKDDDGNYLYKGDELRGSYFLRCSNYNRRPTVVNQRVEPILDPQELVSGDYVNVKVSFYGYAGSTNKGVSPGLEAVQLVRKGEPLGNGGSDAKSVFTVVEDELLA